MSNVRDLYRQHCEHYRGCVGGSDEYIKYEWAAFHVFDLTTYDSDLDKFFVEAIIEVCRAIHERKTFEYIRDGSNYKRFILVCQMLDKFHWIEWGTSIRGAWFDAEHGPHIKSKVIVDEDEWWGPGYDMNGDMERHTIEAVPFTEENLMALIEFIEEIE